METVARDWWLPLALTTLLLLNAGRGEASGYPEPLALPVAVVLLATVALGWRRRRPVLVAVTVSATVTAYLLLVHRDLSVQPALEPFLVALAAMFSLGLHAAARDLWLGLAAAGLPLLVAELAALAAGRDPGTVLPSLLFWAAAVVVGRLIHLRTAEVSRAEQRAADVEQRLQEAAAAERTRIARELHDVVAHGLSVVVLHAAVERRLHDPTSSVGQALDTIERSGRAALVELRQLLGLLRESEEDQPLEPLPSLERLDELVEVTREAGHPVEVELSGDPAELPPGLGLSAYRIVQEALTNVLKHAPGAAVRIHVGRRPDAVAIEVSNGRATRQAPHELSSGGHGLPGMEERARVYGGTLDAGPRSDGGFEVRAVLPREMA